MRHHHLFSTIVLSALTAFAVLTWGPKTTQGPAAAESAFDRVMRTNTLRCGYYTFPPMTIRDPNTGKLSGMAVDMMNYLSEKTGLKVEWTEEVTFGNWVPALQAHRFDAACTPMWQDAAQGRTVLFGNTLMFSAIYPYVRADETRFGADWKTMNKPDVKIVVQEGNVTASLAREVFTNATLVNEGANVDYGTLVQDVLNKKADVLLWDINGAKEYEKTNPGKLKMVKLSTPLKVMPFKIPVYKDDAQLRDFLNGVIEDMQNTGAMQRIFDKWLTDPSTFLYPAKPYAQ